jgi:hypothetical protein
MDFKPMKIQNLICNEQADIFELESHIWSNSELFSINSNKKN